MAVKSFVSARDGVGCILSVKSGLKMVRWVSVEVARSTSAGIAG